MYTPDYFSLPKADAFRLIEANNFGTLVSTHEGRQCATHLPFLLNEAHTALRGHIAKVNPQWQDIEGQEVLAMFLAEHHYISPTWYEITEAVPTWNYAAVHVYGTVKLITDTGELYDLLATLIAKHEAHGSNYSMKNLDAKYLNGLVKGIVGFEIAITSIEAKAKMSQNHPEERRRRVISELRSEASDMSRAVAERMEAGLHAA